MPRQIDRQQPVCMIDALGTSSPFHLEFVRSPEALVAVLKINFMKHGGAERIERGDFAIQDVATKQDIDLTSDWDCCFSPGQRVAMSIILELSPSLKYSATSICPKCGFNNVEFHHRPTLDIECPFCGLEYRRIEEGDGEMSTDLEVPQGSSPEVESEPTLESDNIGPRRPATKKANEIARFRRVKLRTQRGARRLTTEFSPKYSRGKLTTSQDIFKCNYGSCTYITQVKNKFRRHQEHCLHWAKKPVKCNFPGCNSLIDIGIST